MLIACKCGRSINVDDRGPTGSPTFLRHQRDYHPDVWAQLVRIERREHPRTWEQTLAHDLQAA